MDLRRSLFSLVVIVPLVSPAEAQTLTTLYNFPQPFAGTAEMGLVIDAGGNIYGANPGGGAFGTGNVFRLSSSSGGGYTYTSLFDFNGTNGSAPLGGVILDAAGNIFGTTSAGGANGRGTAFRLSDDGVGGYAHSILFNFTATSATGRAPGGSLIADAAGNLYGTTTGGGTAGGGTVFRLASNGNGTYTHSVLHNLSISLAGFDRKSGVVADAGGNLYGTTNAGGTGSGGTVYRLSSDGVGGYTYSTLRHMDNTTGRTPQASLLADAVGNLYGTATNGGPAGYGTVYRLSDNGAGGFTTSVLYGFSATTGGNPVGGLIADAVGNLFGTTYGGGGEFAPGTVFRLSDNGAGGYTHTVLYTFGGSNGIKPYGDLIADDEGNLYGMTQFGGANDSGTIFRISNAGFVVTETVATPEPVSLAIFGMALAGMAARRHPRHKV